MPACRILLASDEIIDVQGGQARCQLILDVEGVTLVDAGSNMKGRAIAAALPHELEA